MRYTSLNASLLNTHTHTLSPLTQDRNDRVSCLYCSVYVEKHVE